MSVMCGGGGGGGGDDDDDNDDDDDGNDDSDVVYRPSVGDQTTVQQSRQGHIHHRRCR